MGDKLVRLLAGRFNLDTLTDRLDPESDLELDRSNLDFEFGRQASLAAIYGYLFAEAEAAEGRASLSLDTLSAELDAAVRKGILLDGGKITEKLVEKVILLKPEFQAAKNKVIDAKKTRRLFKSATDAFEHKLQALINAGATDRANREIKIVDKDGFESKRQ